MKDKKNKIILMLALFLSLTNVICTLVISKKPGYYFAYAKIVHYMSNVNPHLNGYSKLELTEQDPFRSKKEMVDYLYKAMYDNGNDSGLYLNLMFFATVFLSITTVALLIKALICFYRNNYDGCRFSAKMSFVSSTISLLLFIAARIIANTMLFTYHRYVLEHTKRRIFSLHLFDSAFIICIIAVLCCFLLQKFIGKINQKEDCENEE